MVEQAHGNAAVRESQTSAAKPEERAGRRPVRRKMGGVVTEVSLTDQSTKNLLALFRGLRQMGFQLGSQEEQIALAALAEVGFGEESVSRDAIAAVVCKDKVDYPLFYTAWQQFWMLLRRPGNGGLARQTLMSSIARQKAERHRHPDVIWMGERSRRQNDKDKTSESPDAFSVFLKGASTPEEVLRYKEFSTLTDDELAELAQFRMYAEVPVKPSQRRWATSTGKELDLSATLRHSGGSPEIVRLFYQRRRVRPRRVVLLCDVSGSMDPYSRVFLRFAHGLCIHDWDIEVFALSTRLTRVTRWLTMSDSNTALKALTESVPHLSGGTRLAATLHDFHDHYAKSVLHSDSIVLLATDGLDTGQPDELARQLERLTRLSAQVIWLNPLANHPGYTPTARGAQVIARYVDEVLPAHNFAALEASWHRVAQMRAGRPTRRQHQRKDAVTRIP